MNENMDIIYSSSNPIPLTNLTFSLVSLEKELDTFLRLENPKDFKRETLLYLKEVRNGSLFFVLEANATIANFIYYLKDIIDYLLDKTQKPRTNLENETLRNINNLITPCLNSLDASLKIQINDNNNEIRKLNINHADAVYINSSIVKKQEEMKVLISTLRKKVILYWNQEKFSKNTNSDSKAIVEIISKDVKKIIFENNSIRDEMQSLANWQNLAFVVDLEIQTKQNKIIAYKILNYYPNETFNPDE